jgi:pimeloyl-ACP methyl ester carboxylesterase
MATNHTTSIAIKHGANSQGFFSYEAPELLVVFVHGFGGNALGTWTNFPSLVLLEEKFKRTDVIFYGYETLKGQAGDHAAMLYDFLDLCQSPLKNKILPPEQNLPERSYNRILLVAHSLGAILVRQAQLLAFTAGKNWVDKTEMALFAPAHNGANVVPLAMAALPGLYSLIGVIAKFKFPILIDLDADNSNTIWNAVKTKTQKLQDDGKGNFTKAKLVVSAMGDKVIRSYQYLDDVPAKVVTNSSHMKVCKPLDVNHESIMLLKSII